jgi:hypothetical protein
MSAWLPHQRRLTAAAVGPVPYNWLAPTGRAEHVLTRWGRGELAEVPVGVSFDVVVIPGALARGVVGRLRHLRMQPGPVVLGPSGAEMFIRCGSASRWNVPDSHLLRRGGLVLLPPPTVQVPDTVGCRGWLVPPADGSAAVPCEVGLGCGSDLAEPVRQAVQAAAKSAAASGR